MDKDLKSIKYKNIEELLNNNASINTLIYTSQFIKKCINKSCNTYHRSIQNEQRSKTVSINNRDYNVIILYSPSRNGLRNLGPDGEQIRLEQYRRVFGQNNNQ